MRHHIDLLLLDIWGDPEQKKAMTRLATEAAASSSAGGSLTPARTVMLLLVADDLWRKRTLSAFKVHSERLFCAEPINAWTAGSAKSCCKPPQASPQVLRTAPLRLAGRCW